MGVLATSQRVPVHQGVPQWREAPRAALLRAWRSAGKQWIESAKERARKPPGGNREGRRALTQLAPRRRPRDAAWTGPLAYAGARRAAVSPMSGRLPGMGRRGAAAGPRAGPPRTGAAGSLSWETGRDGGWANCPHGGTDSPWELKGRARTCEGVGLGCVGCGAGALLLTA